MSQVSSRAAPTSSSTRAKRTAPDTWWDLILGCGIILVLTSVVYWPAFHAGFVWDDDSMLTENAAIKSPRGLYYIWCTTALPDYFPLTSTSLWVEWRLWGMRALGYHATNVLLHALSVMVLWRVFRRLSIFGAFVIATILAVHPVNVESVAWIAERKNVLAMLFYALTWYAFVRSEQFSEISNLKSQTSNSERTAWYWFAVLFFLLALLSKTAVVMFPVVLLLFAWWRRGNITIRDFIRSVPFFALSLGFELVTMWFQSHRAIAGDVIQTTGFWSRLAAAGWAFWFYLFKAVLPFKLSFVYPEWEGSAGSVLSWIPLGGCLLLFAALVRWRKAGTRHALFALGYFVLMLFPILGFINIYFHRYSLVADHWQYFSLLAIVALVVAGAGAGWQRMAARMNLTNVDSFGAAYLPANVGALLCVAGLSFLSFQKARSYENAEKLWTETLRQNPRAWMAENNLGQVLASKGRFLEAMDHYAAGLLIKPDQAEGHNNLGSVLMDLGRLGEAGGQFQDALKIDPRFSTAVYNLGNVADRRGNRAEALSAYRRALELNPDYPEAHNNVGCLLAADGDLEGAVQHFRQALRYKPAYPDALNNLGSTLTEQGKTPEAVPFLRQAIDLNPNYADPHYNLANALAFNGHLAEAKAEYAIALRLKPTFVEAYLKMGSLCMQERDFQQALVHLSRAVKLQPNSAEAHYQLGILFAAQKQFNAAINHYLEALRANPDWPEALSNLAWIYATNADEQVRNGREAVRLASRAAELTGHKDPGTLDTLAAAQAEAGEFTLAVATEEQAADLAQRAGMNEAVQKIKLRLESYRQNKPWRD